MLYLELKDNGSTLLKIYILHISVNGFPLLVQRQFKGKVCTACGLSILINVFQLYFAHIIVF